MQTNTRRNRTMNMSIKKRMALGAGAIATVAAVGTLVAGVTFGFFSATSPTQTNSFTAGTVTLSQTADATCPVINIVPGDHGTCTFTAQYTGSVAADLGLDVSVTGTPGTAPSTPPYAGSTDYANGAPGLFDGTAH